MAVGFPEFQAYCAEQQVTLREMVAGPGATHPTANEHVLFAIRHAGQRLREAPHEALADRPFEQAAEEAWPHDMAARTLHHLVNASFRRESPPEDAYDFPLNPFPIDTCSYTDRAFSKVINELRRFRMAKLAGPCILYVYQNRPLILQKSGTYGVPSGLTLEETWIRGINYPAGSIVRVNYAKMEHELWGNPPSLAPGATVRSVHAISGMGFQRLSALAFSPEDRPAFFKYVYESNEGKPMRDKPAQKLSMEDVRRITGRAVSAKRAKKPKNS